MQRAFYLLFIMLGLAMVASTAMGQANPCNPCNPCGGKMAVPKLVPVNPCHAKHGTVFYIADAMGRNQVTFTSEAPLEDIVGTTNQIVGYLVFDPDNPRNGVRGFFKVPVKSLDTGIPLRDEHLQSKMWLDAARYPDIIFTVESGTKVYRIKDTRDYQTYTMTLSGTFSIHGQTRHVSVPARITFMRESDKTRMKMPGNLLGVRADISLGLATFNITGPESMDLIGSKVGETVHIEVSAFASDITPPAGNASNPCNPCNPRSAKAKNPCNPCGGKKRGS